MTKRIALILTILVAIVASTVAYAAEPTQAEIDAFNAARELYDQSMSPPADPFADPPPPTPEELKQQAIDGFNAFLAAYPESTLGASAQYKIGWSYIGLGDNAAAKTELLKVVDDHPASKRVDDARYQAAFIDYRAGTYSAALAAFESLIADYEGSADDDLTHKVPFAYFMVGECYRMMNDMTSARAEYNALIAKFPTHSQARRAKKRLSP